MGQILIASLEAVMNLLRNGLLMRKTEPRGRTELTEIFAFLCGFPAQFITRSISALDRHLEPRIVHYPSDGSKFGLF
jgi:hypothetical protein